METENFDPTQMLELEEIAKKNTLKSYKKMKKTLSEKLKITMDQADEFLMEHVLDPLRSYHKLNKDNVIDDAQAIFFVFDPEHLDVVNVFFRNELHYLTTFGSDTKGNKVRIHNTRLLLDSIADIKRLKGRRSGGRKRKHNSRRKSNKKRSKRRHKRNSGCKRKRRRSYGRKRSK